MEDYLISMAINVLLTTLKSLIKNPDKKQTLKKALMKVYFAIEALYIDDNDEENNVSE